MFAFWRCSTLRHLRIIVRTFVFGTTARRVLAISDVRAEPFGLDASTEVPIYFSFTTGQNAYYGRPYEDDGSVRMMVSLQLTVFCEPEFEPCTYVEIGKNNDCSKLLEAPGLPPVARCILGPYGIMTLKLRGALQKDTRYDLLALGTLPPAGKVITGAIVRILEPAEFLDIAELVSYEVAEVPFGSNELVVRPRLKKFVTALELVSPTTAEQGVALQQYTLRLTGSEVPFGEGDQIRIFPSPFIHPDEGLSFGGPCDGFDVSGFAHPLHDCTCEVASVPGIDARVGYNVVVLTFGPLASLAEEPQYFRVALNTPKRMGSVGLWFVASRDFAAPGGEDVNAFNRVMPARDPFFVSAQVDVVSSMDEPEPVYGAKHRISLAIFPRVNLLGNTIAPPTLKIIPPAFFEITSCRIAGNLRGQSAPEAALSSPGAEDAHCVVTLNNNANVYAHQSVSVEFEVVNPNFAISAELWHVSFKTGDGSMSSSATFPGWPVYRSVAVAFAVPLTLEYAKWNEILIFFRPALTTPPEPRVVISAPYGFLFEEECAFDIVLGFPHQGVQCSNPLSETGHNLFALRMPMMTAFERDTTYAANIYPLRNPHPESHTYGNELDSLPWQIDLVTMDGAEILETSRAVPLGPHLRGFGIYPRALHDPEVVPTIRTPGAQNEVQLRFRLSALLANHGVRLRVTAPFGYRWMVGASVSLRRSVGRGFERGQAQVLAVETAVQIAPLAYSEHYPPVVPPHNELEISMVRVDLPAGTDLILSGTILNAAIDPMLNEDVCSANVWVIELYEPSAGYLQFGFRHQAVIFPGFPLKAITGGSVTAWMPFASRAQTQIMLTFRLGTALTVFEGNEIFTIEVIAPDGFFFPTDCAASRISPLHLAVEGFSSLPPNSIASCRGGGEDIDDGTERIARVELAEGVEVQKRVLIAMMLQGVIPDTMPFDNTWAIRTYVGAKYVEEQTGIAGFRLSTQFLSATYHPGTVDTGEDLRVGASDNRVMFSAQPASPVEIGGELHVTAPYRFSFARDCRQAVYGAKAILTSLGGEGSTSSYHDLPPVASCLGVRNVARLTFVEQLDVAIRYTFRITVSNPVLPHPPDWPLQQRLWRLETFKLSGAPLNSAEVRAFSLWAFARVAVVPLTQGASEHTVVTVELEPSLTVPPYGFLLIELPTGFIVPANPTCAEFQLDTYGDDQNFKPLPPGTVCTRGPGGEHVAKLLLDGYSYLAASTLFRFRIGVDNPSAPTPERDVGAFWSIASAEVAGLGEAFLERNPAVEGYPVHERLKNFVVTPGGRLAASATTVTIEVAVHDSLGTFEVLTTTEASYLIVDMPVLFSVRTVPFDLSTGASSPQHVCEEFEPVYPEAEYFPVPLDGCSALPNENRFRLRLVKNLLVGPDYTFTVGINNPNLTALVQRQLSLVNVWQVRLVRVIERNDVTFTGRSVRGYRVIPLLQHVKLVASTPLLSVRSRTLVSISFEVVSGLSAGAGDSLLVRSPPSVECLTNATSTEDVVLCQLWVDRQQQLTTSFLCMGEGSNGLRMQLIGAVTIPAQSKVQLDFNIYSGSQPLEQGADENMWSIASLTTDDSILDQAPKVVGFTVFPALVNTSLVPKDVSAMSFRNHAEFRFQVPDPIPAESKLFIVAPAGFTLYPQTFKPLNLPGSQDGGNQPKAQTGSSDSEAIITLQEELTSLEQYTFKLTIGNPPVSPPENEWVMRFVSDAGDTLSIDSRVPGFVVESVFNTTFLEAQLDEPLAENYVHILVALGERLVADSVLSRTSCEPTVDRPVCPPRRGLATFLVVDAPKGFVFQTTCGYWTLLRVGSRHSGLPPGSICRADPDMPNIARVQIAQSLEPLRLYEFTLQVRNGISVPFDNVWQLHAVQDGVIRERNMRVPGYPLRQLRTARLTPTTTLAGVVDNIITVQMRSERPITRGAVILIVAPVGFSFDLQTVASSFQFPATVELQEQHEDGSALRFELDQRDFAPPNTYFYISARVRNPPSTPQPNYWYFYLQSQFLEHIDLRKYFPGFVIAHKMLYCQVYPNNLPWNLGTFNDISILFVTTSEIFTEKAASIVHTIESEDAQSGVALSTTTATSKWQLSLVAPVGFTFPPESIYSNRCSGFRRWGGKESYDQLPETTGTGETPICIVKTSRSAVISVPVSIVSERRYSFRLNVTVASTRKDIARQEPWRLVVLYDSEILHMGEGPSPLLDTYYEAEWFYADDEP